MEHGQGTAISLDRRSTAQCISGMPKPSPYAQALRQTAPWIQQSISPDSKYIAVSDASGVRIIDATTNLIIRTLGPGTRQASFSTDSASVFYLENDQIKNAPSLMPPQTACCAGKQSAEFFLPVIQAEHTQPRQGKRHSDPLAD